jgi:glutamate dehydrogenase (NAD(P)+)
MDEELGPLGFLVIDRTVGSSPCGGGIRLAPGLTVEEIAQLARCMTLKFAFLNIPTGGAKAGITAPPALIETDRQRVMAAFGRSLSILIRRRVYFTGEDLGTTLEDINAIRAVVGEPPCGSDKESLRCTAFAVRVGIRETLRHLGLDPGETTAAIEGLGSVGSELAVMLRDLGVKVVAVSTKEGAVHDAAGLDVGELVRLRREHGDRLVCEYHRVRPAASPRARADLLKLPATLLIPCARTWTIHSGNAAAIRARVVVPAANAPVTSQAARILHERGILYLPDFVASCGAVLRSRMVALGLSPAAFEEVVERTLAGKVAELLDASRRGGVSPLDVATRTAWRNFRHLREEAEALRPGRRTRSAAVVRRVAGLVGRLGRGLRTVLPALRIAHAKAALQEFRRSLVGEIEGV